MCHITHKMLMISVRDVIKHHYGITFLIISIAHAEKTAIAFPAAVGNTMALCFLNQSDVSASSVTLYARTVTLLCPPRVQV